MADQASVGNIKTPFRLVFLDRVGWIGGYFFKVSAVLTAAKRLNPFAGRLLSGLPTVFCSAPLGRSSVPRKLVTHAATRASPGTCNSNREMLRNSG
jgi:hypothetical protein